jgi:uncharacterized membrane protein
MQRLPQLSFVILLVLAAAFVLATGDRLPEQVASHFGSSNLPNGAMTRSVYRLFMLAFTVGFPVLLVGMIAWLSRAFPDQINIPNRIYWLAPERRPESLAFLRTHAYWLGCLMVLFIASIHFVILQANATVPPRLPIDLFFVMIAVFLAGLVWWMRTLYTRFRRTGRLDS